MGLVEVPGLLLSLITIKWARFGRRGTCGGFLTVAGVVNFITVPLIIQGYHNNNNNNNIYREQKETLFTLFTKGKK